MENVYKDKREFWAYKPDTGVYTTNIYMNSLTF